MGDDRKRGKDDVSVSGTFEYSPVAIGERISITVNQTPTQTKLQSRSNNLPPRNHDFVGREDELQRIHDLLSQGTAVALKPASVSGMGGVGKTQLAIEYAHRHKAEYDHICWVDAEGEDIVPAMTRLATSPLALQVPVDAKTADVHHVVLATLERDGRHLLILDNVDHPKGWRSAIPTSGNVRVLITTRRSRLQGAKTVEIEVLPRSDALRLLRGDVPLCEQDESNANALCEELGDLALAVAVAAKLLESPFSSPGALLQEIRERGPLGWSDAQHQLAEELDKHPSLFQLFKTSLEQLDRKLPADSLAIAALSVGGWLAPIEVDSRLLLRTAHSCIDTNVDPMHDLVALRRLISLGLARSGDEKGVIFHQLLREFGRVIGGPTIRTLVLESIRQLATATSTPAMMVHTLLPFRPHLEVATEALTPSDAPSLLWIPHRLAQLLGHLAEYSFQIRVANSAQQISPNSEWAGRFHFQSGIALRGLGKYSEALTMLELARSEFHNCPEIGPSTTTTVDIVIGEIWYLLGEMDQSIPQLKLALDKARLTGDVVLTATALNTTATALMLDQTPHPARKLVEEALALWEEQGPERDIEAASCRRVLGTILRKLDLATTAFEHHKQAHAILSLRLGADHPDTGMALMDVAVDRAILGQWETALAEGRKAHDILNGHFHVGHPQYAHVALMFGELLRLAGHEHEGVQLVEQAIVVLKKAHGAAHPFLSSVFNMADASVELAKRIGLQLHFPTTLGRIDRLLVDGTIVGVLGRDTDVELAEFRQEDERTIVRLTGEHQADLELVADALWHGVDRVNNPREPRFMVAYLAESNGLTLHFSTKLTRVDRLLVDGIVVGVLGRDTDVEVAEFRQDDERTIVRLAGEHQADLELVADALWHRVWDEAARAQHVHNHAPIGQQINVQGNVTFHLAATQVEEMTSRLQALHTLAGSLDTLRLQLDKMELRLPSEAAVQVLNDEASAREQLELVASWDFADDPEVALARLLLSLFPDSEDLKRLVSRDVSTAALAPLLPGGTASPAQVAWATARAMGKAGAVEGVLERLKAEVPAREEHIDMVLEKWRTP